MKKLLLFTAVASLALFSTVQAHDADPVSKGFNGWGTIELGHYDQAGEDGFKGTFTLTATNTGTEAWGNFHFAIFDPTWNGQYKNVYFTIGDGSYPKIDGITVADEDFDIVTNAGGYSQLDIYFYNTPVNPYDSITFTVYTDNTTGQHSFFGIMAWPSPVPEPATLAILGLGGLAILRRRSR